MHLAESSLEGHIDGSKVGVWGHDTHDATVGGVQTRCNNSQNDILAGKDTRNSTLILNENSGCTVLLHELGSLLDRSSHAHGGGGNTVKHGLQSRPRHLAAQGFNVLDNLLGLGRAQLRLDALEGIVKLSGRRIGTLKLLHSIVKALGIGGTGIGSSTERVLGHDFGNSNGRGLVSSSHNTEGKILSGEDTSNSVVIVGYQDTVLPLRSHQLSSLRDGGTRFDLKSLTGLQGENSSGRSLSGVASSACEVLLL
ncbi:hypothetical protein HG530_015633 [Fusarium avenaceum]|nr:hypothetical protein HG530_015633 [Fusarium avenaceum]